MSELEPCLFCGGENIKYSSFISGAICSECGAMYPANLTKNGAIKAWNARAERTCNIFGKSPLDRCSNCGSLSNDEVNGWYGVKYCHNCGSRVVK